jgi:hypothetical protein
VIFGMMKVRSGLGILVVSYFCAVVLLLVPVPNVSAVSEPGFYGTLRGFVGELGNVIANVTAGIEKLGRGIKSVEEFLDATIDEECIFECPNGKKALMLTLFHPLSGVLQNSCF